MSVVSNRCFSAKHLGFISGLALSSSLFAADANIQNSCYPGGNYLINYIDRPTVGYSACVIPGHQFVLESGYQYQKLLNHSGSLQDYPESEFRFGLGQNYEFTVLAADYNTKSTYPFSGFTTTSLGVKKLLSSDNRMVFTAQAFLNLPSGSARYGDTLPGFVVNPILSYNLSSSVNLTGMLSVSEYSTPAIEAKTRYTSFNPNLVISYSPADPLSLFVEFFSQTKTDYNAGSGTNMDLGLLYLLHPKIVLDVEYGQRLNGALGGYENYFGAGVSILVV